MKKLLNMMIRILASGFTRRYNKSAYKIKDLERIQSNLRVLFPGEENYLGKLSEAIHSLNVRFNEVVDAERKLYGVSFQSHLKPTNLQNFQQEFFDKQMAFLQSIYSSISTLMLFIKSSNNIKRHNISTGISTKKFLESCLREGIIKQQGFDILFQAVTIRSLASDHIQDGLLNWSTASFHFFAEELGMNNEENLQMYVLIFHTMKPVNEYKKDIREQLEKLCWVSRCISGILCPHFYHIIGAYMYTIVELSKHKKQLL